MFTDGLSNVYKIFAAANREFAEIFLDLVFLRVLGEVCD